MNFYKSSNFKGFSWTKPALNPQSTTCHGIRVTRQGSQKKIVCFLDPALNIKQQNALLNSALLVSLNNRYLKKPQGKCH